MPSDYCYPDSDILKNKLNITNAKALFDAETKLTSIRLQELQENPLKGDFDFIHFKSIHKYIFQDLYSWAGEERTVELGKGNLFCLTRFIQEYATSVFFKYYNYDEYQFSDKYAEKYQEKIQEMNKEIKATQ